MQDKINVKTYVVTVMVLLILLYIADLWIM